MPAAPPIGILAALVKRDGDITLTVDQLHGAAGSFLEVLREEDTLTVTIRDRVDPEVQDIARRAARDAHIIGQVVRVAGWVLVATLLTDLTRGLLIPDTLPWILGHVLAGLAVIGTAVTNVVHLHEHLAGSG